MSASTQSHFSSTTVTRLRRTFQSILPKPKGMETMSPSASVGMPTREHSFLEGSNLQSTTSPPKDPRPELPWDESQLGTAKSRLNDADFTKKYLGFTPNATTGTWSIFGREKLEAFLMRYLKYKRELLRQKRDEQRDLKAGRGRAMRVDAQALGLREEEADAWMEGRLERWYREVDERYIWLEDVEISARRIVEGPAYWPGWRVGDEINTS